MAEALGVILDPGVPKTPDMPNGQPAPVSAPPPEPAPTAQPAAQPAAEPAAVEPPATANPGAAPTYEQLQSRLQQEEQARQFWADLATRRANAPVAPSAPPPTPTPAPQPLAPDEIADRLVRGDLGVLDQAGYVDKAEAARIARAAAAEEAMRVWEERNAATETMQRYPWLQNQNAPEFLEAARIIQSNPALQQLGRRNPDAAILAAAEIAAARTQGGQQGSQGSPQGSQQPDYQARVAGQSPVARPNQPSAARGPQINPMLRQFAEMAGLSDKEIMRGVETYKTEFQR